MTTLATFSAFQRISRLLTAFRTTRHAPHRLLVAPKQLRTHSSDYLWLRNSKHIGQRCWHTGVVAVGLSTTRPTYLTQTLHSGTTPHLLTALEKQALSLPTTDNSGSLVASSALGEGTTRKPKKTQHNGQELTTVRFYLLVGEEGVGRVGVDGEVSYGR